MATKRKTPAYKRSHPANPYNNAGPKVKATSGNPNRSITNAVMREGQRAGIMGGKKLRPDQNKFAWSQMDAAESGMARKNAQRKAMVGLQRMTSPTNPKMSSGVNAYTKYNRRVGQLGKKAATVAKGAGKVATAVGVLGKVGNVALAGQIGYSVGSALNKKFKLSTRIVDKLHPDRNYGKRKRK